MADTKLYNKFSREAICYSKNFFYRKPNKKYWKNDWRWKIMIKYSVSVIVPVYGVEKYIDKV